MKKEYLEQLKKEIPENDHVEDTNELRDVDAWVQAGKPFCWEVVQQLENYVALRDTGYGSIALFKDDVLQGIDVGTVISNDYQVVLVGNYNDFEGPALFKRM